MTIENLASSLLARADEVITLFIVVCLAAAGVVVFDPRAQAGLKYFAGSVCFGMACGIVAMVFDIHEGFVLLIGMAGMATAPATIAWLSNKRIDEVIDEFRRRRGDKD